MADEMVTGSACRMLCEECAPVSSRRFEGRTEEELEQLARSRPIVIPPSGEGRVGTAGQTPLRSLAAGCQPRSARRGPSSLDGETACLELEAGEKTALHRHHLGRERQLSLESRHQQM